MTKQQIIELKNVFVAYQDKIILEDISISIQKGDFWGILGPNGSGKTTLLKTILGLVKPVSGEIKVFGKEPHKLGHLTTNIGYVSQNIKVDPNFPIKVKDVVLLGRSKKIGMGKRPKKEDITAVEHALERVEMSHAMDKQFGNLSGGQKQRVLIARALALEPHVLLLDEPSTGLDVASTESFYEWLNLVHKNMGITLLLVSHDVGVISRHVTAIACLNKRLVAHGIPEKVLGSDTLKDMYGCQAMFFHHGDVPHMVVPHSEKKQ